jgi:SNF2-related domain/SNF2 Helicase protein/Helicase conserved C-terminal domain
MSRERAEHVAQGTWRSGSLHIWGWNGDSAASAAWLYGGFGHNRWSGAENGWHDTPASYGELSRIELELPSGRRQSVPSVRLDAYGAAVWLSDTPDDDELSASLAWFAELSGFAVAHVTNGRLTPTILEEGPFTVARWIPVVDHDIERALAALDAAAPPICRNGTRATAADMLATLVDGLARSLLRNVGWKPDLGRQRSVHVQALRAVFTSLARGDAVIRGGTTEFHHEVESIRGLLHRHSERLAGRPVFAPRVRLTIPEDAGDPWEVTLEVYDELDPGRWCTADDIWAGSDIAIDLAREERHLTRMEEMITDLASAVAQHIPGLADLAAEHEPCGAELDLVAAGEFLDVAPYELERLGIAMIGPEHLVAARVALRGRATPAPVDDRRQHFGVEAIVDWSAVIDDTPISDAELARVEAAGARLLHTGNRWVRIDPAGLRRARAVLSEHRQEHASLDAVSLLRLASGNEGGTTTAATNLTMGGAHADERVDERVDGTEGWVDDLLAGLPDERLEEVHEAGTFKGELRHYQRRGLAWMQFLARLGLGGCLADDMGLGKTATTLAHLVERPGPHLVVCPLSVVHNWEAEAARFTPSMRVVVHHGAERQRNAPALFGLDDADLVVTTYGLVARDLDSLTPVVWTTLVLDEAQMIKNPTTKAARAVRQLRAGQKLALTGTPVENRLSELWAILDAVNPGLLGGQQRFRERFGTPIERYADRAAAERLRRLTQPFVLRRTKADRRLLPDLPDKIEQIAFAQLTREQAVLYQQVVDQLLHDAAHEEGMRRRGRVLAALTRLKQVCNHPAQALRDGSRLAGRSGKLNRFDELVAELLDVDERALVFTQFREMGELLQRHVSDHFHIDAPFLHGGVGRAQRDRMVAEFQAGTAPPLLLVSLRAGGTGLNLTAASQVIHYDRWWNPAVEDQATDRAWRIGQHRTVNVHKLVCEGTVEERIGQVIDDKRALADAAIGSGEGWLTELDTDDLRDLVALDRSER